MWAVFSRLRLTFSALFLGDLTSSLEVIEGEDVLELGVCEHD